MCHKTNKLVCMFTYSFNINVCHVYYEQWGILGAVEDVTVDQDMILLEIAIQEDCLRLKDNVSE